MRKVFEDMSFSAIAALYLLGPQTLSPRERK